MPEDELCSYRPAARVVMTAFLSVLTVMFIRQWRKNREKGMRLFTPRELAAISEAGVYTGE